MNKIAKRAYFALILSVLLLLGMCSFVVRYFAEADQWAGNIGNAHLYNEYGELEVNIELTDQAGKLLYSGENGKTYANSSDTRMSVLHLTGDRAGNIPTVLLDEYGGRLIGYNKLFGLYNYAVEKGAEKLTIYSEAQTAALYAMNGYSGTVGVYNYKTGEILCAVSTPTFDPENVPDIEDNPAYNGVYVNRFLHATYTPGSIFKIITTSAAINELPDWDQRTWNCTGTYELTGQTVVCHGYHGEVTMQEALAHSCNVAFAQIAEELGEDVLRKYVEQAGVLNRLSFDGFVTHKGSFPLENGTKFEVAWAGIGQHEDLVNPCQFMTYMGAIANGGQAAKPYFVSKVTSDNHVNYRAERKMLDRVMENETAELLRDMMRYNVETMYGAITLDLPVCAKSGTAEVGNVNNATFAGFIDSDLYPLAFIVVVEGGGSGSEVAAPIANAVLWQCITAMRNN